MIFTAIIFPVALIIGLAFTANLAMTVAGRTRAVYGTLAIGITALSQQFLVAVIAGTLLVLVGTLRHKSKNPMQRKLGRMNVIAGLVLIGFAVYVFFLR